MKVFSSFIVYFLRPKYYRYVNVKKKYIFTCLHDVVMHAEAALCSVQNHNLEKRNIYINMYVCITGELYALWPRWALLWKAGQFQRVIKRSGDQH